MSSSNEIQTNPGETSTPVVQPTTLDTTTITTTTNNSDTATISLNKSNKEVDHHNNVDNSTESVALAQPTSETTPTINSATINNGNDMERPIECMCPGIWNFCCKKEEEEEGPSSRGQDNSFKRRIEKLEKNLNEIDHYLEILDEFKKSDSLEKLRTDLNTLKAIVEREKKKPTDGTGTKTPVWIPKISKEIMKFKQQISSTDGLKEKLSLSADLQSSTGSKGGSAVLAELGNVHQNASFINSSFYNEIQQIFDGLDKTKKFLLSCFTVFPENAVVKRSIFVYWGLGEDKLYASGTDGENAGDASLDASVTEDKDKNTPEQIVDRILEEFQEKGLIEAATKKRKQREHVKSYKMHSIVRSAVINFCKQQEEKDKFFDYDIKGNVLPQRDWASDSDLNKGKLEVVESVLLPKCTRMCLLTAVEHEQFLETKPSKAEGLLPLTQIKDEYLEKIVTLFNVNEPFPDLELAWLTKLKDKKKGQSINKEPSAVDWLSKMKTVKVVCLGSWPGSAKPHIEVESIEFLKGLTNSKDLRFLSLQGVSRIKELPDSIGKHSSLVILDLKECHNLEMLPEEITKLTKLRYLDLSDCYLLARMPKGLGALSELVVFKGFVISNPERKNSGTLNDLKGMEKLRKLTINASSEEFPTLEDLLALQQLGKKSLRKLTIAWGAEPNKAEPKTEDSKNGNAAKQAPKCLNFLSSPRASKPSKTEIESSTLMKLPEQLEKLDLQCFPKSTAKWLTPESLPDLEELYIRGGNLATLEKSEWSKVKTLRLKYLRELKMTWIELQKYFPKLEYLEKVKCPGITLCPCDQHGVWMKTI